MDVLSLRAIAPDVAEARGYRTGTAKDARAAGFAGQMARPGMLIPGHNTQGEVTCWQLRPHDPPLDDKGRPRKYLWAARTRMQVDVPPASLPYLHDVSVPLILTESILKADAVQSAITPGTACVIGISGVYGWRSGDMPLSDFSDIPWKKRRGDRVTFRRTITIAFDSDTRTNEKVARARWDLTEFLRRKQARVAWLDVPTAADGSKQGIDDALASGHDLWSLMADATAAPDIQPGGIPGRQRAPDVEVLEAENRRLKAECARKDRENLALIRLLRNPHVNASVSAITTNLAEIAIGRKRHDKTGHDGTVRLSPGDIANDFRSDPNRGERLAKLNRDGSMPLMRRAGVDKALESLKAQGLIDFEKERVKRRRSNGSRYGDWDYLFAVPESVAAFVKPLAHFRPAGITQAPYTRQAPCPHCHEVHSRKVVCDGCGSVVKVLSVPVAQDPNATAEQRADIERRVTTRPAPAQDPESEMPTKNVGISDSPQERMSTKNVGISPDPQATYLDTAGTAPAPGWEDDRRRTYGAVYRGEVAS
jgi:hypothetical protein